jgi:hypothetical protein
MHYCADACGPRPLVTACHPQEWGGGGGGEMTCGGFHLIFPGWRPFPRNRHSHMHQARKKRCTSIFQTSLASSQLAVSATEYTAQFLQSFQNEKLFFILQQINHFL